jgi:hypothetical protein
MSDEHSREANIGGVDKESLSRDLVFLLTPAFDIQQRIEPEEFIAFVLKVDLEFEEHFRGCSGGEGVIIQVACALLPGRRKLLEFQIEPQRAAPRHVQPLAQQIDRILAPEVFDGPVAFFRRAAFGEGARQESAFGLPFLQLLRGPGMVLLDDVLMAAAGIKAPSTSVWHKFTGLFRRERRPARTIAEHEFIPNLSQRLGHCVIAPNGRMSASVQSVFGS